MEHVESAKQRKKLITRPGTATLCSSGEGCVTVFSDIKKEVSKRDFLDVWFKWVGYFLVVATLIATGSKADSYVTQGVGYISGVALTLHAISALVEFGVRRKDDDKNAWVNAISIMLLVIIFGLLIGSVSEVIKVAIGGATDGT